MKVLIVVDMQNDFITGSLGSKDAQKIVGNVINKIKEYKDNGDKVIFTRDTHYDNYLKTHEGKMLPVKHCIAGTEGWQIPDIIDRAECEHINKPTFGWDLWRLVIADNGKVETRQYAMDNIEIIGLCTDICVISNALILRSAYPEANIVVDASCCAGTSFEKHEAALEVMKSCQIEVINE